MRDLGPGRIRGVLYDWGSYPAATLDEDGVIAGEWVVVTDEGMHALDALEDYPHLYTRTIVSDEVRDLRGWVYCMPAEQARRGGPRIAGGDWVAHVARRHGPR
ncbi:AIG2 family protein [Alicyclobacillus acidocaldarius subsp. acidocaldarius Tc-4-1]|uniref:AIG2 family protein n=1 Tax=Alicyclobacillus acidocaldarius (strain Tc-4-1) TaxID=1048834 RepID=F8III3_ALIAT|nr:AIG2 family protein [Alicyclobacillus acidocaldarius subsp. acidocaldarius Tc-4-1]